MSQADKVREYCKTKLIEPARARGAKTISIRAGDIHLALRFNNRLPLVCSALGSDEFEELTGVQRISLEGTTNGANTVFKFRLE